MAKLNEYKAYKGKEDDFQISAAKYLDALGVLWFHPANERKLNVVRNSKGKAFSPLGAKLKRKGVKSGVPDIVILEPRGIYHGLFLELKVGKNKTTPNQEKWKSDLNKRNYLCLVSYSLEESENIIKKYLSL